MFKIGIIGLGFVGNSMLESFKLKGHQVVGYDKFKDSDSFENCLDTQMFF